MKCDQRHRVRMNITLFRVRNYETQILAYHQIFESVRDLKFAFTNFKASSRRSTEVAGLDSVMNSLCQIFISVSLHPLHTIFKALSF